LESYKNLLKRIDQCNYIDCHLHLCLYKKHEHEEFFSQLSKHNVLCWANSMDWESYYINKELVKTHSNIIQSFGWHPSKVERFHGDWGLFEEQLQRSKLIGEVGLDFYWADDVENYSLQIDIFDFIVRHAKQHNKIINVHTKGAEKEVYEILYKYGHELSIIHWYSGPIEYLHKLVELNCYFSFGVELKSNAWIQSIIKHVPMDRILPETDNPSSIQWLNGYTGMPNEIIDVYKDIEFFAEIKNFHSLAKENFKRLIQRSGIEN